MKTKEDTVIELTEAEIEERQRALKDERVARVSEALNKLLKEEKCALVPQMVIQGGQIASHQVAVVAL